MIFGLARSIAKHKGPAEFRKSKSKAFDRYKEDLKTSSDFFSEEDKSEEKSEEMEIEIPPLTNN